jgi:hypothetical protein
MLPLRLILYCAPLLLSPIPGVGQDSASQVVHFSGCIKEGVKGGCKMVKDQKTCKDYNVFSAQDLPKVKLYIRFTGTLHDGPTTCMEGTPVNVTKAEVTRLSCTSLPPCGTEPAVPTPSSRYKPICTDWSAFYDVMPAQPKTLHIGGSCSVPVGTKGVTLVAVEPPGINPAIYLMDIVTSPEPVVGGHHSQALKLVKVSYTEQTDHLYQTIQLSNGDVFKVLTVSK